MDLIPPHGGTLQELLVDEERAEKLRVKLTYLDAWNERRREVVQRYLALLADSGGGLPRCGGRLVEKRNPLQTLGAR